MARYTGPKHKLARREGVNILDKTSASLQRRLNIPPGLHGRKGRRRVSEYGTQLREKQKAKAIYGLMEKQFRKLVNKVSKEKGDTAELLIIKLETRLDNVVYRLGLAKSRFMARQIVSHGHVLVNNKKVNVPSFVVRENDVVKLSLKMKKVLADLAEISEEKLTTMPPFLKRTNDEGKMLRMPKREDIEVPFNTQLIIEYYSR